MASLYVIELDEGKVLPENTYLLQGKLCTKVGDEIVSVFDGTITGNPFYLLPSKEPEKLIFAYFETDAAPWAACGKDARKALKLDDSWKADGNHWWILPIPLVDSGSGKYAKHHTPVGMVLAKYLEFETAYTASVSFGATSVNCRQLLTGKFIGGEDDGEELSERELKILRKGIVDFAPTTINTGELDAVKAFCLEQKVPGKWSNSAETLADRMAYRKAWIESDENLEEIGRVASRLGISVEYAAMIYLS